jgi:hypothetical protein
MASVKSCVTKTTMTSIALSGFGGIHDRFDPIYSLDSKAKISSFGMRLPTILPFSTFSGLIRPA